MMETDGEPILAIVRRTALLVALISATGRPKRRYRASLMLVLVKRRLRSRQTIQKRDKAPPPKRRRFD